MKDNLVFKEAFQLNMQYFNFHETVQDHLKNENIYSELL